MKNLPEMTLKVYEVIARHIQEFGYGPTLREIADLCYIRHSSVLRHLDRLEGMDWVERVPHKARSMRLGVNAPDVTKIWDFEAEADLEPEVDEPE